MIVTSQSKLLVAVAQGQDLTQAAATTHQTAQAGIDKIVRLAFELHLAWVRRHVLLEPDGRDLYLFVNDCVSHILLPVPGASVGTHGS